MLPKKFRIYVGISNTRIFILNKELDPEIIYSVNIYPDLYKLRNRYYDTLYRIVLYSKEFNTHEKV